MNYIRDRDGNIIQQSRNLAGIRRYVSGWHAPIIKVLALDKFDNGDARLSIAFDNGCSYEADFSDFSVLKEFVRRWLNVHGAPLLVNGEPTGLVSSDNHILKKE